MTTACPYCGDGFADLPAHLAKAFAARDPAAPLRYQDRSDRTRWHPIEAQSVARERAPDLDEWERMRGAMLKRRTDRFHAHLDVCRQCDEHPFDLCALGRMLLA